MLITPQTQSHSHYAPTTAARGHKEPKETFEPSPRPRPTKCWPGGMGVPVATEPIKAASAREIAAAVTANNKFTLELHRELANSEGGSFFVSPFNANGCLSMVLAAAEGTTAEQLASTLGQSKLKGDRVHAGVAGLNEATKIQSEGVTIGLSNRVFGREDSRFSPEFKSLTRDTYGAESETLDFEGDPEGARGTINQRIAGDTDGKITELLPAGSIQSNTECVLTSAINFDGKWAAEFPENRNSTGTFNAPDGPKEDTAFMSIRKKFNFAEINFDGRPSGWNEEPDLKVIEVPYQDGRFTRVMFLPKDGLKSFEAKLTPENLAKWGKEMHETEVGVTIPKNESRSKFKLKKTLTRMGAGEMFSDKAQLTGLGPGKKRVSEVFHETYVRDDNKGTKFTAATGAVVTRECVMRSLEFVADKPYFTLVRDNETGAFLATQRVECPTWTEEAAR